MKTVQTTLKQLLEAIGTACEWFCATIALVMVALVTIQVVLRAFNMPLFGIEELLNFPTIWIYFIGGACAAFTNSHIECGIIKAVSKNPRLVLVAELVSSLIATGLGIYVLKWAVEYSQYCLQISKTSPVLKIPMPLGEMVILIGLSLMALYSVAKTIALIAGFKQKWQEGETK